MFLQQRLHNKLSIPLFFVFSGVKCKDLQRNHLINQLFCLGAVVTIKVRENDPPIQILYENDFFL